MLQECVFYYHSDIFQCAFCAHSPWAHPALGTVLGPGDRSSEIPVQFFGQYRQRLDARHRVILPQSFRDAIGEAELRKGLVLTRGFDRCLYLFPACTWKAIAAEFSSVLFKGLDARMLERLFVGEAVDLRADKLSRISLPGRFCEQAGVSGEVLFVGAAARMEIWDPARWDALEKPALERYEELAEAFHRLLHGPGKA